MLSVLIPVGKPGVSSHATLKSCSYGAIATAIFIAQNGLYGIQCKCSCSAIVTVTLNPIQPISAINNRGHNRTV